MEPATDVLHEHRDLIHDVAFDFYGSRMATCSSDQTIKIFDKCDPPVEGKSWRKSAEFRAHNGAVWRICWAHPEFGQILASCSLDHCVTIWEEMSAAAVAPTRSPTAVSDPVNNKTDWQKRADLTDSRGSVWDVRFAPRHLGLRLAAGDADGQVRLYEAADIVNIAAWNAHQTIDTMSGKRCVALSWTTTTAAPPVLAIALQRGGTADCPDVQLWQADDKELRKWTKAATITRTIPPHFATDVSFAPNFGRSYNILALGTSDATVALYRVAIPLAGDDASVVLLTASSHRGEDEARVFSRDTPATPLSAPAGLSAAALDGAGGEASAPPFGVVPRSPLDLEPCTLRLSWNMAGNVLASSSDDGSIRVWRQRFGGREWTKESIVRPEATPSVQASREMLTSLF